MEEVLKMAEPRAQILDRIQAVIRQEVKDRSLVVDENTRAPEVSGWDSLAHVQIVVAVEKAFGIRLKASEVDRLENVGSLVDIVMVRGHG